METLYSLVKQTTQKPMYAKVTEGIWVGNKAAAEDLQFLADADITAIVNLSGSFDDPPVEDVDYFDYMLPSQELMDTEFPKTFAKLDTIAADIKLLRDNNRNILIHCSDGKNKCMLAAGYYMTTVLKMHGGVVTDKLEYLYFTPEMRHEEEEDRKEELSRTEDYISGVALVVSEEKQKARDKRNAARCFTMSSFRKILRLKSTNK